MVAYQDLSKFKRGAVVGAREMGHSISEVAMDFHLRPFHECTVNIGNPAKHQGSILLRSKKIMQEQDQRRLAIINKRNRRATLQQIAAYFNVGLSTSNTVQTIQRNIIDMDFRS
ncbi:HTH_Tnp_Tc3_2 domain-containing protein [Trichonephila clavipes]|nr:HTH_Tnp_Tc3_2 domain-containing protein [Trichonephila clavipes]